MKTVLSVCFGLMAGLTLQAQSEWVADRAHTSVEFEITHLMISTVTGKFGEFAIKATADDAFGTPNFAATIQTASINTDNERRDNHLRSGDFFEAETYPEITFVTTSVASTGEKTFDLNGDLTMRGVTKPVTLKGTVIGVITDQRSQKLKAGVRLSTTLNRRDFGVGEKMMMVGDEVEITIRMEMAQQ